jgi:hypothetical protein
MSDRTDRTPIPHLEEGEMFTSREWGERTLAWAREERAAWKLGYGDAVQQRNRYLDKVIREYERVLAQEGDILVVRPPWAQKPEATT